MIYGIIDAMIRTPVRRLGCGLVFAVLAGVTIGQLALLVVTP